MADPDHLRILKLGTRDWNRWRKEQPSIVPDLSNAHLREVRLSGADLTRANCTLTYFGQADLSGADLTGADLSQAYLRAARLPGARLERAQIVETEMSGADLSGGHLRGANLHAARLRRADVSGADFAGATLTRCDLRQAIAVGTIFRNADLSGSAVHGIAAWDVDLLGAMQNDLTITPDGENIITTDNLAIAQFLYLLIHNERVRDVIETVGRKTVLILGRFSIERKATLEALRAALRRQDLVPVLFDFEKPHNRDLTETIVTLAHLSRAIIADLTDARSVPHELMAIVPGLPSVPVHPIIEHSSGEYATFEHLARYPWVAEVFRYSRMDELMVWLPAMVAGLRRGDSAPATGSRATEV